VLAPPKQEGWYLHPQRKEPRPFPFYRIKIPPQTLFCRKPPPFFWCGGHTQQDILFLKSPRGGASHKIGARAFTINFARAPSCTLYALRELYLFPNTKYVCRRAAPFWSRHTEEKSRPPNLCGDKILLGGENPPRGVNKNTPPLLFVEKKRGAV